MYYNVFRAFISILRTLKLDLLQMCHDDYVSPFTTDSGCYPTEDVPPVLHPTILQRTVPHNATLDIFPSVSLRDNMLRRGQYHKEDGKPCTGILGKGHFLCDIFVEDDRDPVVRQYLYVWRDYVVSQIGKLVIDLRRHGNSSLSELSTCQKALISGEV